MALTLRLLFALCLACRTPSPSLPHPATDDGLPELLRSIVTDSLVGGGRREGQRYVAADSTSASVLRATGLEITLRENAPQLTCPGSTDAAGKPAGQDVGYVVRVARVEQGPGVLRLQVAVSCVFSFRGAQGGFAQGGTWELRIVDGRWRVARTLGRWIT